MSSLIEFIENVSREIGLPLPKSLTNLEEVVTARRFLRRINEYFFQTHQGLGYANFDGEELQYFSEFHKYWETHHGQILDATIDDAQARTTASCLAAGVQEYGPDILRVTHDTCGISPQAIAQVRFFTANQDFREPPKSPFEKYLDDPTRFDAQEVHEDPEGFLRFLGVGRLSQNDKRFDFARNAAYFLIQHGLSAYDIAGKLGNDATKVREALTGAPNMGYGNKKANMFIRDMFELEVWPGLLNIEAIDVASDINTMKLALRTKILVPAIPLLSSLLDIFCHQYGYIDAMSASAWRAVWQQWKDLDPQGAPASPCQMDFLLYRIGREYCKDMLVKYSCTQGHTFHHFGARLHKCRIGKCRACAMPMERMLPCQVAKTQLPREDGRILLRDDKLLSQFDGVCIFEGACLPKDAGFVPFDPPKSISIKGKTGWTNAYADRVRGGGGLMA